MKWFKGRRKAVPSPDDQNMDALRAIDTLTNNLCNRLSMFVKEVEHISKSELSSMNSACKLILAREFQLLLIHHVDRLASNKGLQPNVRRIVSVGILSRLTERELFLSDTKELSNRDEYYAPCTDLFPRFPGDPRALIGKLILKVKEQTNSMNLIDKAVVATLAADLVVYKDLPKSDVQALHALKSIVSV